MQPFNSIRARLTLVFSLATAFLMLLACGGLIGLAQYHARRTMGTLLRTTVQQAEHDVSDDREHNSLGKWLQERRADLDGEDMAALLVDSRGAILDQTQPTIPQWPRRGNDGWRVVTISDAGQTLIIGYPWGKTEAALKNQALLLAGLSLFVVLVTAASTWALVGQTLSPIRLLSRQAQAASTDNLQLRLSAPSQDAEVVELVTMLNGLLTRLAGTAAARGRFYAAASHELRTPLQALSGHLELALNRPRDAAAYRAMIEEAHTQTRRLTSLAQELLFLNRLDTVSAPPPCHPIDLSELCERLLTHFQPLLARRCLTAEIQLAEGIVLLAPPAHLEMLVRNLIENAAKYASEGSVRVTLSLRAEGVVLEVFNTFVSEPHLNPEQLFEPFFRPDASRNSETGGNGLGLTICRALAVTNGWNLEWRHDADGVRVIVVFPGTDRDLDALRPGGNAHSVRA